MQRKSTHLGSAQTMTPPRARSSAWHAVSVTTGRWSCEAARGVLDTRFLSRDAPRLPLQQCNAPEECSCAYKHHADRRGPPRRKDDIRGIWRAGCEPNERRTIRGRREDD